MNTRGEQLELHEIAKAKLLEVLESDHDKDVAALIWEKCSDMNSYVQMNFNVDVRRRIFTEDWSSLSQSIKNFDSIKSKISAENKSIDKMCQTCNLKMRMSVLNHLFHFQTSYYKSMR